MSQAFVREGDEQWLHDIPPTMNALLVYLSRENNGVRVYEQRTVAAPDGKEVHMMSNGLSYKVNAKDQWEVV
jgi:hypothetical protein